MTSRHEEISSLSLFQGAPMTVFPLRACTNMFLWRTSHTTKRGLAAGTITEVLLAFKTVEVTGGVQRDSYEQSHKISRPKNTWKAVSRQQRDRRGPHRVAWLERCKRRTIGVGRSNVRMGEKR